LTSNVPLLINICKKRQLVMLCVWSIYLSSRLQWLSATRLFFSLWNTILMFRLFVSLLSHPSVVAFWSILLGLKGQFHMLISQLWSQFWGLEPIFCWSTECFFVRCAFLGVFISFHFCEHWLQCRGKYCRKVSKRVAPMTAIWIWYFS